MKTNWHRAVLLSLLMIFSSLAGCLEDDAITNDSSDNNDSDINSDTGNNTTNQTVIPDYGNIMVSTYHVAQLVSAIVGPTANIEMMSTSNIPVHDYKPSLQDTVRLANSDVFFYHGLNLEPWVAETLSTLGADAPPAYATHTMPTGEITPDFQSLLVSDLCKQLNEGERVSNTLMSYESQASELEIHLERGVQSLTFPPADTSHEGHDHDDDHDDNHSDDGHDDEDLTPQGILDGYDSNNDSLLSWDEFLVAMEEEDNDDHDNHSDDGHDEHGDDMSVFMGIFNESDADGDGLLDITELENFIHEIDEHDDHDGHAHAEAEKVIQNPAGCPSDTVISIIHLEEGEYVVEFETDLPNITSFEVAALPMLGGHAHHDHGDHGDHGDDGHEGHDEEHHGLAILFPDNTTSVYETEHDMLPENATGWNLTTMVMDSNNVTYNSTVYECCGNYITGIGGFEAPSDYSWYWAIYVWNETNDSWDMSDLGIDSIMIEDAEHIAFAPSTADVSLIPVGEDNHDEHDDEPFCHNTETHENTEHSNRTDCEAAGHLWMEGEPNDGTLGFLTIHVENEGDYGFALPSHITAHILLGEGGHDDHAGHDDHGDDAHDDHGDESGESNIEADEDEDEFEYDPHSWLDPVSFKAQVSLVLDALILQFPEGNETFTANAQEFMLELDRIHLGYINAFGPSSTCTTNLVAANHNAYSYLTVRYGIEFVTVHGLDPEGEPSVADITEVIEKINEDQINILFIEEYTQRSSVDSIVDSTGIQVLYLYTMEMAPSDASDTYLTMMNKNLENLKTGMGCTA